MAETEVAAPSAGPSQVVVSGTPAGVGEPTKEGKILAERMNKLEEVKVEAGNTLADRILDSGLGYYDDNVANKRYIAKLDFSKPTSPIGTPTIQIRKIPFPEPIPGTDSLSGVLVLREDGSFYSIPGGTTSLGDVVDPDSGEPLIPAKADAKKAKARAAGTGDVKITPGGKTEAKDTATAPKHLASQEKGNKAEDKAEKKAPKKTARKK